MYSHWAAAVLIRLISVWLLGSHSIYQWWSVYGHCADMVLIKADLCVVTVNPRYWSRLILVWSLCSHGIDQGWFMHGHFAATVLDQFGFQGLLEIFELMWDFLFLVSSNCKRSIYLSRSFGSICGLLQSSWLGSEREECRFESCHSGWSWASQIDTYTFHGNGRQKGQGCIVECLVLCANGWRCFHIFLLYII